MLTPSTRTTTLHGSTSNNQDQMLAIDENSKAEDNTST